MSACHSISGTVQWTGFKGTKNGDLPRAAEVAGYQVMLTVDQAIPHQIIPASRLVDMISQALETIQPGQTVAIPSSD